MKDRTRLPAAVVAHTRSVAAPERERLAERIVELGGAGLLVRTCHRVEFYSSDQQLIRRFDTNLPPGAVILAGDEAARHLISVAVGLDSVMLGEDQILHQVRTSMGAARRSGHLDPVTDRLATLALRAGRQARSWQSGPSPSLVDAAFVSIERRVGSLSGRRVLVVGAGTMGSLAVTHAHSKAAIVSVASRTPEHARGTARRAGVEAMPIDPGLRARDLTAVVVAIRGGWELSTTSAEALIEGAAVIVDLSVPTAVAEPIISRLGARFVSIDGLAPESVPDEGSVDVPRMHALVDATLAEFLFWTRGRGARIVARSLTERAENERLAALEHLWRRLPDLEPGARSAIEQMSQHLTSRILREPLERLGSDRDGRAENAVREIFAL